MLNESEDYKSDTHLTSTGASKIDRYSWAVSGMRGSLEWVDPKAVRFDPRYQREHLESKVMAIARKFSWPAFGAVLLGRRENGSLWAMDGQHRILAARKRTDCATIPAIVFEMRETVHEARAFLDANTQRKPLTSLDKFKAQVEVKDPAAMLVKELATSDGRGIGNTTGASLRCVTGLIREAQNNPDRLRRVWPVISAVCQDQPIQEIVALSLIHIEAHMPEGQSLADTKWQERILRAGNEALIQAGKKAAVFYSKGGPCVWARGIVQLLNGRLPSEKRIRLPGDDAA